MREHPRRGIGLRNMRERIENIGGRLSVHSQPGRTRILAELSEQAIARLRPRT
jgi:two-component system, NarL family, sensor kinase